jgi:hypothetical protein
MNVSGVGSAARTSSSARAMGYASIPSQLLRKPPQRMMDPVAPALSQTQTHADRTDTSSSQATSYLQQQHHPQQVKKSASDHAALSTISWTEYFRLRRTLRLSERAGALIGGAAMFLGSSYYFVAVMDFDPDPIMGMDPSIVYGAGIVGLSMCAAAAGLVANAAWWRIARGQ